MIINLTKLLESSARVVRFDCKEGSTDRSLINPDPTQDTAKRSSYSFDLRDDQDYE